ncbi:MAG: hypothetical protein K0U54_12515, partial [Bacteroidetes bacterium]|nr:hypothetical protein [Bacteroidota bacterium]
MKIVFIIACLLLSCIGFSQSFEWTGEFSLTGIVANEDASPFWLSANRNSQYGVASNFSALGILQGKYAIKENHNLEFGAAFFYRDNITDEFARRDLYLEYSNNWLSVLIGAKKSEDRLQGLSASNKNFLLSQNARPLGGLLLEAPEPLLLSNSILLDWGFGHFIPLDDRFVENSKVHYKRLGLQVIIDEKNSIKGQIQHYAQWGGTSPEFGDLPEGFDTFTDDVLAKGASDSNAGGEIQNAVGNHLGSYLFEYEHANNIGVFQFYHEHPFEDGSGTAFKNFPDGVWGAYFAPDNQGIISGLVYEYIHTNNQSVGNQAAGADNYFSNNVYRNGWTHDGFVLGTPF